MFSNSRSSVRSWSQTVAAEVAAEGGIDLARHHPFDAGRLRLHQGHVEAVGHSGAAGLRVEAERPLEGGQLAGLDETEAQLAGRLVVVEVDDGVELLAEQVGHHPGPGRPASVAPGQNVDPLQVTGPFRPPSEVGGGREAGGRRGGNAHVPDALDGHRRTLVPRPSNATRLDIGYAPCKMRLVL